MLDQILAPDLESLLEEKKEDDIRAFLRELHPADIADILMGLEPRAALDALKIIGQEGAAKVFRKLPEPFQVDIAEFLDAVDLTALARSLAPDDRVRLLKALPVERSEALLSLMDKKEGDDMRKMARFTEGTAGSLMTTEYLAMSRDATAGSCLGRIRLGGGAAGSILSVFALGDEGLLEGSASLAALIRANPDEKLSKIMDPKPLSIAALNDRKEVFSLFFRYDLLSLPVVDAEGALLGLITHDDMVGALERERTADMERFMAISGAHDNTPYLHTTIWQNFRNRIGWLIIFAFIGLLSGTILQSFGQTLASFLLLAFYMPMLANTGGISGSQSAAIIVRAIILKEILPKDVFRVFWKEMKTALLLGLTLGFLAFARVMLTSAAFQIPGAITIMDIGLAISIALAVQVIVSTILGAVLPIMAAYFGANPAHSGSPALMTIADITGFFIYFGVARLILRL